MRFKFLYFLVFLNSFLIAQEEKINYFHSEIKIDSSSVITVTETIDVFANEEEFQRGIVRSLPRYKTDNLGNKIDLNYKVLNVKKNNIKEPFHIETDDDTMVIYIGDEGTYIPAGNYKYQLTYTAENTLSFYDDFDELYWNVNGFEWQFDIDKVSATVILPNKTRPLQTACYTGEYGSQANDCISEVNNNKAYFEATNLQPNKNLTIAVGFNKGIVKGPPPPSFLEKYIILILGIILNIILSIYYYKTWCKYGVDPPKPTPNLIFDVPNNLSPASIGIIYKEYYWDKILIASMANLGVKGFIQIKEADNENVFDIMNPKQYTITKLKEATPDLPSEETIILKYLFDNRENTITINGSYNSTLKEMVTHFKNDIRKKHKSLINEGNNSKFLKIPFLSILGYTVISLILNYFYRTNNFKLLFFLPLFISLVLFFVYLNLIERPSEKKLEIQSLIEGFKMYLMATEEKLSEQSNPPEITLEIFEKYLPYAIVLGVDRIWGENFRQNLRRSYSTQFYDNIWYIGGNFSYMYLEDTLSASSGDSFSDGGSSGGGFSGGGSGGGGGDGW